MKKTITLVLILFLASSQAKAQAILQNWWLNTSGATNNGILADVEDVWYRSDSVWIQTSGVPSYASFGTQVFDPSDLNNVYRITRSPQPETGTHYSIVEEGNIGVALSGALFFSPGDGQTWMSQGYWHRIAYEFEGGDFDTAYGHSNPSGTYHHHVDPIMLHDMDSSQHSPIIGWAFDGYPIYGPFGYSDSASASSGITRMRPGYQLRSITQRTTLPDGTVATGPPINTMNALGKYIEDFDYVQGSGHLDRYNGRNCVTPEYPNGTYAYFATVEPNLDPKFPFLIGLYYYGVPETRNMGPMSGNVTIPSNAVSLLATTSLSETINSAVIQLYPNPASNRIVIEQEQAEATQVLVYSVSGQELMNEKINSVRQEISVEALSPGVYTILIQNESARKIVRLVVAR